MTAAFSGLVDFLLPPTCGSCRTQVERTDALCPSCWHKLSFISTPYCACCGVPFAVPTEAGSLCAVCLAEPPPWASARAALVYDEASRALIGRFKYSDHTFLAPTLLPWLERAVGEIRGEIDLIVPVPLHRYRLWRRRYNQSALLARLLSERISCPSALQALERTRRTRPQVGLEAEERKKNVKNAFAAKPDVKDKRILLVDDVFTTGATLSACTKALLKAGAKDVRVLTLARVVRPETLI